MIVVLCCTNNDNSNLYHDGKKKEKKNHQHHRHSCFDQGQFYLQALLCPDKGFLKEGYPQSSSVFNAIIMYNDFNGVILSKPTSFGSFLSHRGTPSHHPFQWDFLL